MSKRLVILFMLFLVLLSGCSAAATPSSAPGFSKGGAPEVARDSAGNGMAVPQEMPAAAPAAPASDSFTSGSAQGNPEPKRLVIRNANLTIIVADPAQSMAVVSRMAEDMGGYVVASNLYKTSPRSGQEFPEANITIRVPADKLTEAMDKIKGQVKDKNKDVLAETVSGQDVTKEYTDLNSRLKNLEDTEAQLREIMSTATKSEDVLAIYNQLTQVREQIEVTKGQIKYYEESAALSSIAVLIQSQAAVQPLEVGGWQPVGVARDAIQALIDTGQFLGSAAIWLILFALPVGLLIFLPLRLLWWLIRRNRKPKAPAAPVAPIQE